MVSENELKFIVVKNSYIKSINEVSQNVLKILFDLKNEWDRNKIHKFRPLHWQEPKLGVNRMLHFEMLWKDVAIAPQCIYDLSITINVRRKFTIISFFPPTGLQKLFPGAWKLPHHSSALALSLSGNPGLPDQWIGRPGPLADREDTHSHLHFKPSGLGPDAVLQLSL